MPPARVVWSRLLLLAVVVGLIGAFYALGGTRYLSWEAVKGGVDGWAAQTEAAPLLAVTVFFAVYVAVTALSLPVSTVLGLLAGALFGRWLGTAVVSAASTLGATLAFLISRYLLRDWVRARFGTRLAVVERGVERDGAFFLFTLRLVPVFPFFLVNATMGLTAMPAGTFAAVSWAGMLLGTFLYVNAGTALAEMESPRDALSPAVVGSLALLGLAPLVVRWLRR
ncbi:MAG: TVP38/TMEM64 family protein, partial [Gemmataceae bacterium]